jgi:acyl-[acyl-carrier-protein]-phospholipid O-acyltransferase / long-chain-fatty-acid--[acyl-carrier-protein] ligase
MVPHLKVEEEIHKAIKKKDEQACVVTYEQVCVVTSIPDEKKGEALAVLYQGNINIDELYESLNNSDLPKLWIPKKSNFFHVEAIPILGSGKSDLKQIKKIALERSQNF